jgi:hypothetical protein
MAAIILVMVMPAAYADENIVLNIDHKRGNIITHFVELYTSDKTFSGKVYPSLPSGPLKFASLVYYYENVGPTPVKAFINVTIIDSNGVEYAMFEYTGREVAPNSKSELRFIEYPVPKDAKIVKFKVTQDFDMIYYDVPQQQATVVPTPTATPAPTVEPEGMCGSILLPFFILGGVAAGVVINRYGKK